MKTHRPPTPASQQRLVDAWNARHNETGVKVTVTLDDGTKKETVTRSAAKLLSGHTAVIHLEGISGLYCLDRVKAIA